MWNKKNKQLYIYYEEETTRKRRNEKLTCCSKIKEEVREGDFRVSAHYWLYGDKKQKGRT